MSGIRMNWRRLILICLASAALVPFACNAGPDYSSGVSALKAGNYEQALSILRPLAETGNRRAIVELGNIYAFGWGVTVDDAAADEWFRKAEERGVTPGQSQLDVAFELKG